MKNFLLLPSLLSFIVLATLSSACVVARQSDKTTSPYENPDAYDVYSAVLSMDGPWADSKSLVVLKELPPKEWPIGSPRDALLGDQEFRGNFESIFKSFEQTNRQPVFLENLLLFTSLTNLSGRQNLRRRFIAPKPAFIVMDGRDSGRTFPIPLAI